MDGLADNVLPPPRGHIEDTFERDGRWSARSNDGIGRIRRAMIDRWSVR